MKKNRVSGLSDRLFLVEGARAVAAFLESPLRIESVVAVRRDPAPPAIAALVDRASARGLPIRWVDEGHARRYFETKSPQGIGLLVERPVERPIDEMLAGATRVLVLDGLNDPGNAGALIRSAHLLGWDAALLTEGSVTPWSEKTVRASAGALGFIPTARAKASVIANALATARFRLLVADPNGKAGVESTPTERIALILGSEARGASSAWPAATRIAITTRAGAVDSLGVAASGAILLDKLKRAV